VDAFCPFVLEIFYLGITTGTTATTYDPASPVSRLQMAAFLSRTVDRVLGRGSRRAAVQKFWVPRNDLALGLTTLPAQPYYVSSDGKDLWVSNTFDNSVTRVRGSDGRALETWTGATLAFQGLSVMGRILVAGQTTPGRLYRIDPAQAAGAVTTVASNLGDNSQGITFDGARVWMANAAMSVSIVTPGASIPWTVTTVPMASSANGAVFDGASVWISSYSGGTLLKLDSAGSVLQTVTVGVQPFGLLFDGTNLWVVNRGDSTVSVVRAATGVVLATLTGNGLASPQGVAFDGERILVADEFDAVSLWKAASFEALGTFPTGTASAPNGACSDGTDFWIALAGSNRLARF